MGGNSNILNKQIRFRYNINYPKEFIMPNDRDNNIIFDQILNAGGEIWTYEELDDIIYGFIKTANEIIKAECVNGFIELKNKNGYDEKSD